MKFLLAILLVLPLVFSTSCGEEKKKAPAPKKEKLVDIKDGVYTEYYPGRKSVKFQGPITKDNKRDGRWFFFSENGTEMSTTEYTKGVRNGLIMVRYPSGNVRYSGFYTNGTESGKWRFYLEDGTLDFEKDYDEAKSKK
jgi:antitoxin component YwqK of YwqJK toxin-antitoxin module